MLYSEIERLSEAWQALDEQNASKVFNLAAMEEKMQRLSAEVSAGCSSGSRPSFASADLVQQLHRKRKPTTATLQRCDKRTPWPTRTPC
jgi:hypothetical protein